MAEELQTCTTCGSGYAPSEKEQAQEDVSGDVHTYHEETKLAVLIALVPAMTMTVFNLMGLI